MTFKKLDKNILEDTDKNLDNYNEIYAYKNKNNDIVGIITISSDNVLNFAIKDKFQGIGYGKKMVHDSLYLLKQKGLNKIYFMIDRKNTKAIKIVTTLGAEHLSNINNVSRYVVNL